MLLYCSLLKHLIFKMLCENLRQGSELTPIKKDQDTYNLKLVLNTTITKTSILVPRTNKGPGKKKCLGKGPTQIYIYLLKSNKVKSVYV